MFRMDESEHTAKDPPEWWELLDETAAFIRFNYEEIQAYGSDELKEAAAIILGGHMPGGKKIEGEPA